MKRPNGSARRRSSRRKVSAPENRLTAKRVDLSDSELEVILRACRKYRASIPVYLQSAQREMRAIDSIIRKVSWPSSKSRGHRAAGVGARARAASKGNFDDARILKVR